MKYELEWYGYPLWSLFSVPKAETKIFVQRPSVVYIAASKAAVLEVSVSACPLMRKVAIDIQFIIHSSLFLFL